MDYLYNLKIPAFPYDKVPNLPTAGEYVDGWGGKWSVKDQLIDGKVIFF